MADAMDVDEVSRPQSDGDLDNDSGRNDSGPGNKMTLRSGFVYSLYNRQSHKETSSVQSFYNNRKLSPVVSGVGTERPADTEHFDTLRNALDNIPGFSCPTAIPYPRLEYEDLQDISDTMHVIRLATLGRYEDMATVELLYVLLSRLVSIPCQERFRGMFDYKFGDEEDGMFCAAVSQRFKIRLNLLHIERNIMSFCGHGNVPLLHQGLLHAATVTKLLRRLRLFRHQFRKEYEFRLQFHGKQPEEGDAMGARAEHVGMSMSEEVTNTDMESGNEQSNAEAFNKAEVLAGPEGLATQVDQWLDLGKVHETLVANENLLADLKLE